jgi:ABC-2 type transport system permease protein
MELTWELAKRSFKRHLTYRTAAFAGLITNFFFGIIRATIFIALYNLQQSVQGITIEGAITYAALGQAMIGYLSLFSWQELSNTVYTGDIASDLLKPMNYFVFWLSQDFGRAMVQFLLRGVILLLGFELVYELYWPNDIVQILAVIISIFLSWLISFSWRFLVNLTAFWTPDARGILRLVFVISWFFSGFLMPLRFFPEWVIKISYLTPFPHMFNSIIEIYLGTVQGTSILLTLGYQLLWAVLLIILGQFVLQAGIKKLIILGG